MSDGKMSISEINELMEVVLKACLLLHSQLEQHDFGSEVTIAGDKKFRLTFECIDD